MHQVDVPELVGLLGDGGRTVLLPSAVLLAVLMALHTVLRIAQSRRDPRRRFSAEQKRLLVARAGGRCEHKALLWWRCSELGTEADHIRAWSRGGLTELENGQLLCRRHNRRKSNHLVGPLYRHRLNRRRARYPHVRPVGQRPRRRS